MSAEKGKRPRKRGEAPRVEVRIGHSDFVGPPHPRDVERAEEEIEWALARMLVASADRRLGGAPPTA